MDELTLSATILNKEKYFWTGWSNLKQNGVFTDTQGNQLSVDSDAWLPGEQNDRLRTDETFCVEMLRDERVGLNDCACKHKRKFYCEIPTRITPKLWVAIPTTWIDAQIDCAERGGWLWAPKSVEELEFGSSEWYWTGWNNIKQDGDFTDTHDNQLSIESDAWLSGEPNDRFSTDATYCVESNKFGFNERGCHHKRKYYCEIPTRKWVDVEKTWQDAKDYCEERGGWLWAPNAEELIGESKLLNKQLFWTGWSNLKQNGVFTDTQGNQLSFYSKAWLPGEPNDPLRKDETFCVERPSGEEIGLNDCACKHKRKFYCEGVRH